MILSANVNSKDKPRDDVWTFTGENQFSEPVMEAKKPKILSHKYTNDKYSIWIDANVYLNHEEEWYYQFLEDHDVAVLRHPLHNCIYKEAEFCEKLKKGDPSKIQEQIAKYRQVGYPENNGLAQCCMIIRRHTEEVKRLNEAWFAEVVCHSSRDQLSFPYIFNGMIKYIDHDKTKPWYVAHDSNDFFKRYPHNYEDQREQTQG